MKSNNALIRRENNMELYLVELIDSAVEGTLFERKIFRNKDKAEEYAESLRKIWVYNQENPWIVWVETIKTED